METDITTINDNILTNYERDKKKTVRKMAKIGFVNIDGAIHQYNPGAVFIPVSDKYCTDVYNNIITANGNYWNILTPGEVLDLLKMELPKMTTKDANDFTNYNEQSQVIIDEDLIQDLTKKAIGENKELQRTDIDFKGKTDLISQVTILRNNNIFTDKRKLYQFKDGEFFAVNSKDVVSILNKVIASENAILFNIHVVKNNYIHYIDNLTNIAKLSKLLRIKQRKEKMLTDCRPGFENVLTIISKYGGKR